MRKTDQRNNHIFYNFNATLHLAQKASSKRFFAIVTGAIKLWKVLALFNQRTKGSWAFYKVSSSKINNESYRRSFLIADKKCLKYEI